MLALCNSAVAAEGMMIANMAGVDLEQDRRGDLQRLRQQPGVPRRHSARLQGKFEPSFALDLAYKDLSLAVDLATEHGVPGMVAPQVLNLMRMARGMGFGQGDSTSVIKVYESTLGKQARLK